MGKDCSESKACEGTFERDLEDTFPNSHGGCVEGSDSVVQKVARP
jgi:hypothetical protein